MSRTQAERPLLERRTGSSARLEEIQRRKCQNQAVVLAAVDGALCVPGQG